MQYSVSSNYKYAGLNQIMHEQIHVRKLVIKWGISQSTKDAPNSYFV